MVERIQEALVRRIWSFLHCIDWSDPVKSWNAGPSATFCWDAKRRCFICFTITHLLQGPHISKNNLIKCECKILKLLCVLNIMEKHYTIDDLPPLARQLMGFGASAAVWWHLTPHFDPMNQLCEKFWSHIGSEQKNIALLSLLWFPALRSRVFLERFERVWNCCFMRQVCIGASMKDLGRNMDESQMSMNSSTLSLLSTNSLKLLCGNSPGNVPRKCGFEINL